MTLDTLGNVEIPTPLLREPERGRHSPALDGIRGLAVIMVMAHHWTFLNGSRNPFDQTLTSAMNWGWIGVELFFVLSGFLITGILLDSRGRSHFFRDFYARRTLRIFPLYYAFLFAFLVLPRWLHGQALAERNLLGPDQPSALWYWTYLSNFLLARKDYYSVLGPTWSLAVEEQFYWLWPVVVLLSGRRLAKVCCWLIGLSIAIRLAMALYGAEYPTEYVLMPSHMDGLLVGALVSLRARSAGGMLSLRRPALFAGAVNILVIAVCTFVAWRQGKTVREDIWTQTIIYTTIALLGGSILIHAAISSSSTLIGRIFCNPFLRSFGKYSFAIYLFNRPVYLIFSRLSKDWHWPVLLGSHLPEQVATYALCSIIVFVCGWLSWHLFEVHFLKLKKFFPAAASDPTDTTSLQASETPTLLALETGT